MQTTENASYQLQNGSLKSVDSNLSKQQILSIRLSADGFSFTIHNPIKDKDFAFIPGKIEPYTSLTANIKQALAENEFLHYTYKRTNVLIDTNRYTIIPLALFDKEQAEVIFYQNHQKRPHEMICHNILERTNVVVVFAVDKSTYEFLLEEHPKAYFFATVTPLIEHFAGKSRIGNFRKMFVSLQKRSADVLAFDHGKLLFINTFSNKSAADIAYYMLSLWKQIEFNQEADEVYLVGNTAYGAELEAELKLFIRSVSTLNPVAVFNRSIPSQESGIPYDMLTLLHGEGNR